MADSLVAKTWWEEAFRCKRVWEFNTETDPKCHNGDLLARCVYSREPYHYAEQVWHVEEQPDGTGFQILPILH